MSAIVADLLELFDAEVTATPGAPDGYGAWAASGTPVTLPARYEAGPRMVKDRTGQEVVSSGLMLLAGTLSTYDASRWRFQLPTTFSPHTVNVEAIGIRPQSDEDGAVYTEVDLP